MINEKKCQFGAKEIDFLGHRITSQGAIPKPDKVEAIQNFPQPTTIKGLQEFAGMVNFYHRFIPSAAKVMQPLYQAVAGKSKQKNLTWSEDMIRAFTDTKEALANATMLVHPRFNAPTALTVDASDIAVGAVLQQKIGENWNPLAFFSKQLRPPERKYSAFDRELLAIYLGVRHFRYFLEGRSFTILTDYKPLTFAMAKVAEPWSARQQRYLAYISEFSTDIQHIAGKDNPVADALSRPSINSLHERIDYVAMAEKQVSDNDIQAYRIAVTSLRLEDVPMSNNGTTLLCDVSTGYPRPIVPVSHQRQVFDTIHNLSHPSIRTTRKLVASKFVWHGLNKQVTAWARTCIPCQQSKIFRHIRTPLQQFEVPQRRFTHINVDLVGPLPPSQGYTHLLTIVDRSTRWPEAIPITDTSASACARALINNWIARFGLPTHISSDRGAQFTSCLWKNMAETLGIKLHHTTAYHPQANGMVERFHRHMKESLKARLTSSRWVADLPWTLLGIRTAPKEDLDTSSAELVYGEPLIVPGEFVAEPNTNSDPTTTLRNLRDIAEAFNARPTSTHGTPPVTVPSNLGTAKFVFIRRDAHRNPIQNPYEGPFKVLEPGDKTFKIQVGNRHEIVSADRLKPAHLDGNLPIQVAQPPTRGRPKLQRQQPENREDEQIPLQSRYGRKRKPTVFFKNS